MVENRGGLPYRINWGAGLRVYLIQDGDEIVILLCAGFKDRQNESFNIIYIMRTTATGRRRKRLHRINATPFLTMCPCDGMSFAGNGLQRV
ncbi:hypothetical protein DMT28_00275 [Salmonella enterica]|nr:hypothetical protein [Salmonella enterica]EBO4457001.1 hypothetical protein [Salmonella enterica]